MSDLEHDVLMDISEPDAGVIAMMKSLPGDLLLLGAAGKVGHGLALMARRAVQAAGVQRKVIAVSRFSSPASREALNRDGITTIACDLADTQAVAKLPDASHVVYLAGQKFGTAAGQQATTWFLNAYVPGVVAQRWKDSVIALYSSGNVYPFTDPAAGGPDESVEPSPVGEYAMSVLGRERVFEYFSRQLGTKMVTVRLNYAQEPRYGIIVDLARKIEAGQPIELTQAAVNLVWAGDANRITLKCFALAASPPQMLNLAGPQVSLKELATRIGRHLDKPVKFVGTPPATALLNNGAMAWSKLGSATVDVDSMIDRICRYIRGGGALWDKPTHFEVRDGKF